MWTNSNAWAPTFRWTERWRLSRAARRLPERRSALTDLRAGMALIIAGFMAKGVTEIEDIEHVERGYENIVQKITSLGGEIEKTTLPDSVYAKAL